MGVKIRERFPGQWWLFVTHKNNRTAKPAGDYETALEAKKIIEQQLALGVFQFPKREPAKPKEPPKPTIKEYWETFKETYLKTAVQESTASGYKTNFKIHVLPELGSLRLDEVTAQHMETFIADLVVNKKLAKPTIEKILRELKRMFNRAIKHEIIAKNPVEGLDVALYSQAKVKHEKIEPLTVEEVPIFLAVVQKNRHTKKHYALFLAAIHTGCRAGELAALEWGDIDFRGGFASIERSFDRKHRKVVPTKTKKYRRVDLSEELLEALAALKKARLEEWFSRGKKRLIDKGLWDEALNVPKVVFCNEVGGYMDRVNINERHFHVCLADAKLKRRRFHDLRHTFASLHLTQGAPMAWVSEQMGHSSIEMTVKLYGHLQPGKNRHFVNMLPGLKQKNLQQACNKAENAESKAVGAILNFPVSDNVFNDLTGAGDGDRTRDVQLGKLAFYR
jgi:integrase